MSASNSEASGENNQPPVAAHPQNQPMWDPQGWLHGDPYAPAFAAIQQMNELGALQADEDENEIEEPNEGMLANDEEEEEEEPEEEEPIEEEEEEEEPLEIEENEPEEYQLETGEGPTQEEEDLLSDARTYYGVRWVVQSKHNRMKAKYKQKLKDQTEEIERLQRERNELEEQFATYQRRMELIQDEQANRVAKLKRKMDTLRDLFPSPGKKREVIHRGLQKFDEREEKDREKRRSMGLDD